MNVKEDLILEIENDLNIKRGNTESIDSWIRRIIYSSIGKIGYISLWKHCDGEIISKNKFNNIIKDLIETYNILFPDSFYVIEEDSQDEYKIWKEEILNLFISNGLIYDLPNRLVPCQYNSAVVNEIVFIRGEDPKSDCFKSGLGSYNVNKKGLNHPTLDIHEMFQISEANLLEKYQELLLNLNNKNWAVIDVLETPKHLNIFQEVLPFRNGNWKLQPDKNTDLSLLKINRGGTTEYYKYFYEDNVCLINLIESWEIDEEVFLILLIVF